MVPRIHKFLNFGQEKPAGEQPHEIHFRRLRRPRPTKKLWLLLVMAAALAYLVFILKTRV
ncbi:MAG: hypothetical protein JXQ65_11410 [Candidatus Marinimicrobia bacterium]|nr:hypothetical protein [Candidatus Neomarinimicrobiota bacterium]